MSIKLLQLNMFQGKLIKNVVEYVKENDIDILCLEEVTGGKLSRGGLNTYPKVGTVGEVLDQSVVGIDCFSYLKSELNYEGKLSVNFRLKSDPESYFGNAIFYKKFNLLEKKEIWMKDYEEYDDIEKINPADIPRSGLLLNLERDGKSLGVVTTHLVWGPTPLDEPYKLEQNEKLFEFVKTFKTPFVIAGDFNLTPDSQVIGWFSGIARNLISETKVRNTLNPNIHSIKKLFPEGHAVDYIFVSKDITVNKFRVIDEIDLSDHYGLLLEFEV